MEIKFILALFCLTLNSEVRGSFLFPRCFNSNCINELSKSVCKCCYEISGTTSNCDDNFIKETLRDKESCLYKIYYIGASGSYRKKMDEIDLTIFGTWCVDSVYHNYDYTDIYALSMKGSGWTKELKTLLLEVVYEIGRAERYNIKTIDQLLKISSVQFWSDFYEKSKKNKEAMSTCVQYVKECYSYLSAYWSKKGYLGCSAEDVIDVMESIERRYPSINLKNLIKKLSPKTPMIEESSEGLLDLLCKKGKKGVPKFRSITNWSRNQIKSFFFHTATYYWPNNMINRFLEIDTKTISSNILTDDPYNRSKTGWTFDGLIGSVNQGCLKLISVEGGINWYSWPEGQDRNLSKKDCVSVVTDIVEISNNYYHLSKQMVHHLLSFNYFDKLNKERMKLTEDEKLKLDGLLKLYDTMNRLKEDIIKQKKTDRYITPEMVAADDQKLGIISLINFFYLYYYKGNFGETEIYKLFSTLKKIPPTVDITEEEINQNKMIKGDCDEGNDKDLLCNFRKNSKYQPDFNDIVTGEKKKTWGKIAFVAIHIFVLETTAASITYLPEQQDLFSCIEDLQSDYKTHKGLYCKIFKTNPYFGEFDFIIEHYYTYYFNNL